MGMQGIIYSRRLSEKINPAFFDKEIILLKKSTVINELGEKENRYTKSVCRRGMLQFYADSKEELLDSSNQSLESIGFCIVWFDCEYLDVQNRVQIDGVVYSIIMADEWPSRKRFVRMKLTAWT